MAKKYVRVGSTPAWKTELYAAQINFTTMHKVATRRTDGVYWTRARKALVEYFQPHQIDGRLYAGCARALAAGVKFG